jgi:hypothetical protein
VNDIDRAIIVVEQAIQRFERSLPSVEARMLNNLLNLIKQLKTDSSGNISTSIENLKLVNNIAGKLKNIINDRAYVSEVVEFSKAFNTLSEFQDNYFSTLGTLTKTGLLKEVKKSAMNGVANGLVGAGLDQTLSQDIVDELKTAILSHENYSTLVQRLQSIKSTPNNQGLLAKHSQTYARDAINDFMGQRNKIIGDDLKLEWYMYVGSNLTTTREFCKYLTKKKYVHKSEIPTILTGDIDGHQCAIYSKTGLPQGLIAGTNPQNFAVYRGGWNCGHQLVPVAAEAVPANIRAKFVKPNIPTPNIPTPNILTPNIPTPNIPTPNIPTPNIPTPNIPTPNIPTPNIPTPNIPTPNIPTPNIPTPNIPTPNIPTPNIPTPNIPTPNIPTPNIPTPNIPTPNIPTPNIPTPNIPTPNIPTPNIPTPNTVIKEKYTIKPIKPLEVTTKSIKTNKAKYERLKNDTNYEDVIFDDMNGGLLAIHIDHKFDPTIGKFGVPRGEYEHVTADLFFENGHNIVLASEKKPEGVRTPEGFLDGKIFDIKGVEGNGKRNIIDKLSEASRQGVEIVVLYYPNADMFDEQKIINAYNGYLKLSKSKRIQAVYYIVNRKLYGIKI